MKNHRRTFLKAAGLAGVAIAASGTGRAGRPGIVMSAAHAASSQSGELPKGMTFTVLRRTDGYGLGVRTERGILDVVAAEKDFCGGSTNHDHGRLERNGRLAEAPLSRRSGEGEQLRRSLLHS